MKKELLDIIKHTGNLGFVDTVKITGTNSTTTVEAIDSDRTMIIKGKLLEANDTLIGEFGINNMSRLAGFINHPTFGSDDATYKVEYKTTFDNRKCPCAIHFTDAQKQKALFRLLSLDLVPNQPTFMSPNWDVTISPSKSKIAELATLVSLMGGQDSFFNFRAKDGDLQVWIGEEESTTDAMMIKLDTDLDKAVAFNADWPHSQVLSILKLGQEEEPEIMISSRGVMQINLTSKYGKYTYILPARKQ